MSPEILVGTIGCEEGSLLKCDVYALGIIFWEVLSRFDFEGNSVGFVRLEKERCLFVEESHVNKYKVPFEDQLIELKCNVNNPTVKEMISIINLPEPSNRPLIDSKWNNSKLKSFDRIVSILNECWNQNPDLRIQTGLVLTRINSARKEFNPSK